MLAHIARTIRTWYSPAEAPAFTTPPPSFRVLVPIAGGPNAVAALGTLPGLASPAHHVSFVHYRRPGSAPDEAAKALAEAVRAKDGVPTATAESIVTDDAAGAIVEATKNADLLVLGATDAPRSFGSPFVLEVARRSRCPVLVLRAARGTRRARRDGPRALVVAEGSPAGIPGLETALRWARAGSTSQRLLLGPAAAESRERDPERRALRVGNRPSPSVTVSPTPIGARDVLTIVEDDAIELVVIACDPRDLDGPSAWVEEVGRRAACATACAFTTFAAPPTRRRRLIGQEA